MSESTPAVDGDNTAETPGTSPEVTTPTQAAAEVAAPEDAAPVTTQDDAPAAVPDAEPDAQGASPEFAPAPAAAPMPPRPTPRPVPSPAALAQNRPAPVARPAVAPAPADAAAAAEAATFGRVDDEGNVYVREASGERLVGQFPGATKDEALALYVRRFLDLQAKVTIFEARLGSTELAVKEIDQTLAKLDEEMTEPSAVGDLDVLRARVEAVRGAAAERRTALEAERAAAKATAVAARTAIVEAAEAIAATDPARIQWRPAGDKLRTLLDQWKEAQRSGPRIDRPTEESLWKRFSHARTAFDRERRHFFAELETRNSAAKDEKERLVAEAEALATSTDWGATAAAYRDLMARWKAAGRANRKDDDALWARFRGAQDRFFAARDADNAAIDAEYGANLEVKEALLAEAEALLPVTNLGKTKAALRDVQERWEAAGRVPRGDVQRVEARMRAVETAVREADEQQWKRTNPETRARAEGAAAQLAQAITQAEERLAAAQAKGDARAVASLTEEIAAKRTWLEQVERAANDARG